MMGKAPSKIQVVLQRGQYDCGIATAAMIAGATYGEAWNALAPPPVTPATAVDYNDRETRFLNDRGWWASSEVVLTTVSTLEDLRCVIWRDVNLKKALDECQRVRLVVAFADGAKPDHTVVLDDDNDDLVFDPARGIFAEADLFKPFGLQSYSGTLGMTSYCYQPGQPIKAWISIEEG